MNGIKVAWNRRRTASVVLAKLKEFTVNTNTHDDKYNVKGWFNKENCFSFGDDFESLLEAQKFLDSIFNRM